MIGTTINALEPIPNPAWLPSSSLTADVATTKNPAVAGVPRTIGYCAWKTLHKNKNFNMRFNINIHAFV